MTRRARLARLLLASAAALGLAAAAWFVVSSGIPPRKVVMATGPEGGDYAEYGKRYRALLAQSGVDLRLVPSAGAVENLARLREPRSGVSVAFAMAGLSGAQGGGLSSLGTVGYEPFWLFQRTAGAIEAEGVAGQRVSIGPEGSGTRALSLEILSLLGADRRASGLLGLQPREAAERLLRGDLDALALVASWDAPLVRQLSTSPAVSLVAFPRADAMVAVRPWLNKVVLPRGVADLAKDLPPRDVVLLAPKTSLVVRETSTPPSSTCCCRPPRRSTPAPASSTGPGPSRRRRPSTSRSPTTRPATTPRAGLSSSATCPSGSGCWPSGCWWSWCPCWASPIRSSASARASTRR
jgi:TRAP-type uncharacterized transport system substrate-binding protein